MTDNDILDKINNSVKSVFSDYKGLYYYGSRVKKTFNDDSDYDVVLLLNKKISLEQKNKIYIKIGNLEYEYNIFIDIQFLTNKEFISNSFFHEEVTKFGQYYAA